MSRMAKGQQKPGPEMDRVSVYLPRPDVNALRVKLIEETGSGNVSNWVRKQILEFLKGK
jgi:hypothetical protein